MFRPLVSIITPSYNQVKYIRQTIESVISQDYKNVEYIIIDGDSTDGTKDEVLRYEKNLTFISEEDSGQGAAINKGFRMAKGEIIAWLNSDDIYEHQCISRVVKEFENNSSLGVVYGNGYIINEDAERVKVFEHTQEFDLWKLTHYWDYIMQPTAFMRKDYVETIGYLDESLCYCMDWDLWIRLANVCEFKYINDFLASSREYSETKTQTGGKIRLNEISSLLRKYSREEFPIGISSYKASTRYMMYAKNKILTKIMNRYINWTNYWIQKKLPKITNDGWIGSIYSFSIPSYINCVNIHYKLDIKKIAPQTIRVYVEHKEIECRTIDIGVGTIKIVFKHKHDICDIMVQCSMFDKKTRRALRISKIELLRERIKD